MTQWWHFDQTLLSHRWQDGIHFLLLPFPNFSLCGVIYHLKSAHTLPQTPPPWWHLGSDSLSLFGRHLICGCPYSHHLAVSQQMMSQLDVGACLLVQCSQRYSQPYILILCSKERRTTYLEIDVGHARSRSWSGQNHGQVRINEEENSRTNEGRKKQQSLGGVLWARFSD